MLEPLVTPRLVLRSFAERDFPVLYEMDSNPIFVRYERPVLNEKQTRDHFDWFLKDNVENPRFHYRYVITVKPSDRMRGYTSLTLIHTETREFEIGWSMHPDEWGKGYATEAARCLLDLAFNQLQAHRVIAICHAQNTASERVMQKLGMSREGLLREVRWLNGEYFDELVYGILSQEYAAAQ